LARPSSWRPSSTTSTTPQRCGSDAASHLCTLAVARALRIGGVVAVSPTLSRMMNTHLHTMPRGIPAVQRCGIPCRWGYRDAVGYCAALEYGAVRDAGFEADVIDRWTFTLLGCACLRWSRASTRTRSARTPPRWRFQRIRLRSTVQFELPSPRSAILLSCLSCRRCSSR
jgi:hypothetical protein